MEENLEKNEEIGSEEIDEVTRIKNKTFFNKYHCIKKLGEGSFGMIFKREYNNEYYALKFESRKKSKNLLEN